MLQGIYRYVRICSQKHTFDANQIALHQSHDLPSAGHQGTVPLRCNVPLATRELCTREFARTRVSLAREFARTRVSLAHEFAPLASLHHSHTCSFAREYSRNPRVITRLRALYVRIALLAGIVCNSV